MSSLLALGVVISFISLIFALIFSATTVRRLRKLAHMNADFDSLMMFSGSDIWATAAVLSTFERWRNYRANQGHTMLRDKYVWLVSQTSIWERVLARVFISLTTVGFILIVVPSVWINISS